jgi:hypothetical protein
MARFKAKKLIWMLEDILDKEQELQAGINAWNDENEDPSNQAGCDPSDQYLLGEEVEGLWEEFKKEVNEA